MPRSIARKSSSNAHDPKIGAEASMLGVNIAQFGEADALKAVKLEKARLWKIENAEAIESWNKYVEENGLPLAEFSQF